MKHTLVLPNGTLGQSRDFTDAPPTLAPHKGKWLPDNPPEFDPATHVRNRAAVQSVSAPEIAYAVTPRPVEELAAEAAAAAKYAEIAEARAGAKADAFVQQFVAMTPAQVTTYVNNNVGTLADAKQLLTKLSLMILALAKEQYK